MLKMGKWRGSSKVRKGEAPLPAREARALPRSKTSKRFSRFAEIASDLKK